MTSGWRLNPQGTDFSSSGLTALRAELSSGDSGNPRRRQGLGDSCGCPDCSASVLWEPRPLYRRTVHHHPTRHSSDQHSGSRSWPHSRHCRARLPGHKHSIQLGLAPDHGRPDTRTITDTRRRPSHNDRNRRPADPQQPSSTGPNGRIGAGRADVGTVRVAGQLPTRPG
jgi:hypothetical protein